MIRNIIFDFGGVLLDLDSDRCKRNFHALGFHSIEHTLTMAHQTGLLQGMESGGMSFERFCDLLRDEVRKEAPAQADGCLPDNRAIAAAFCSMADGLPAYRIDAVSDLKAKGYHVSLLSNTNWVHWSYCLRYFVENGHVPDELFDHVWLSCDLRLCKPDPAIFAEVLRRSGYAPDETLFVDDNATNCEVARTFGLQTLTPPLRSDWTKELNSLLEL